MTPPTHLPHIGNRNSGIIDALTFSFHSTYRYWFGGVITPPYSFGYYTTEMEKSNALAISGKLCYSRRR